MKAEAPLPATRRRWRIAALWIVGVVAAYGVLAGLVLPPLAKKIAAQKLGEQLGRSVSIESLSFNPFTLAATVKGFRILEADGHAAFASFDRLDIDGSITSVYRLAPVADQLTLSGLKVHLVRDGPQHYNVTDILARAAAAPQPAKPAKGMQFSLSNIRLTQGRVDFDDGPKATKHEVTEIEVAIPFVSNLPSHLKEFVQPSFSAKVNGTPLKITGETQPFENSLRTHVALDLESLDIPRYVEYSPSALPVKVDAGKLDAHVTVRFTQTAGKDPSIEVAGTLALRDVRVSQPEEPALASAALFSLDLASLDPLAGLAQVRSLRVTQVSAVHGQWSIPSTEASDIRVDLGKKNVRIGSLSSSGGVFALQRGRDGAIELPIHPASTETSGTPESSAPWDVLLEKLSVEGYKIALVDQSVKPAASHRVAITHFAAAGITTEKGGKGTMKASLVLGKSGNVDLDGGFTVDPMSVEARIDAHRLDLAAYQPYVAQFAAVTLKSGTASASGALKVSGSGDAMHVGYSGSASVANVASADSATGEELVDWDSIRTTGIALQYSPKEPLHLAMSEISVNKAYARVVVLPTGKINLQQLKLNPDEPGPAATAPSAKAPPAAAPLAPEAKPRDIRIDRIAFTDSRLNFTDHFIKPNYTADVGGLHGTVTKLSSDPASRATVDLQGSYDATSPVVIAGTINPLSGDLFLDIAAKGKEIELPKLTAYSERYAGYGITSGKLTLDVKYHIENGKLEGRNKIFIDQLVFGNKVESPEATKLPVLFAVNLLKDSKGAINLELPISGSLDDPQFAIGGLITQVLGGLLKKAVTSPFSLLTAALGGGGGGDGGSGSAAATDLSFIDFGPGSDEVGAEGGKKLDALAKALLDRPAVTIELASRPDPDKDLAALKRAALKTRVIEAKRNALAAAGKAPPAGSEVTLSPEEYPRYLKVVFDAEKKAQPPAEAASKESAAKATASNEPSTAQMEAFLLEHQAVGPEELRALALHRSEKVKGYLVEKGHLPPERILLATAAEPAPDKSGAGRVNFALK